MPDAQHSVQAQQKPQFGKAAVAPLAVQARTQEEAVSKAKVAYAAKPKAEAKTGRNFFERLKPEKVNISSPALFPRPFPRP